MQSWARSRPVLLSDWVVAIPIVRRVTHLNYVDCRLAQNNIGSALLLYGASPQHTNNVTAFVDARQGHPRVPPI